MGEFGRPVLDDCGATSGGMGTLNAAALKRGSAIAGDEFSRRVALDSADRNVGVMIPQQPPTAVSGFAQ